MKKILTALFLFGLLFAQTACEDNKDEFLGDYDTILYFKNSGAVALTLYKTGEDTPYQLIVDKAGSNAAATTEVEIAVMDANALSIYNAENGTSYQALPATCYELGATSLNFASSELYKHAEVTFKTDNIDALPELSIGNYVLPLQLTGSPDSINAEKNQVFLVPTVIIPSVYFTHTGYTMNSFTDAGPVEATFSLPIALPMTNQWSFDCTVEKDEALLDEYNQENGLDLALLPASNYTLSNNGTVSFTPDYDSKSLEIKVNRTNLNYGNYVLPLRLTGCTQPGFVIDGQRNTSLYGISYVPDESRLAQVSLTAGMLSTNAQEPSEGSLANLLDGNVETYFHSAWSVAVEGAHYLQVALPTEGSALKFSYTTRSSNGNAAPAEIVVSGSMDGTNFSTIGKLTEGLPTGAAAVYASPVLVGKPFKYVRFTVPKNATGGDFFVWSEFSLKTL